MYTDPNLNWFLEILRFVAFALCLLFNGMLLRMISMPRHNDLGFYRFLLLAFVSADMLHGLIHFIVVPVPEIYQNAFIMGGHGSWTSRYGVGFAWPLAFSLAFPMLSFNFAYRLVAVKYPFCLDYFNTPRVIALLVSIAAANLLAWPCITRYIGFDNGDSRSSYVRDLFDVSKTTSSSSFLDHDIDHINDYIVVVFWDRGFWDGPHCTNIIGSAILGLLGDVAYKFMAYAAYNIVHCLKENAQWSERFHKQHVQLFRALVLQALTPFITSYIPIGLCGIWPFFGADFPLFSVLVPPLCAFHPVLDGVIMLATVSQFRNTLLDWLRCRCHVTRRNSRVIFIEHEEKHTDEFGRKERRMTISPI